MNEKPQRTTKQNNSLHVYFQILADRLNEAGLTVRQVIEHINKSGVEIEWTEKLTKELWRGVQKAQLQKSSTTKLTTDEVDKVYKVLDRFLLEEFGLDVPFPSDDGEIEYPEPIDKEVPF